MKIVLSLYENSAQIGVHRTDAIPYLRLLPHGDLTAALAQIPTLVANATAHWSQQPPPPEPDAAPTPGTSSPRRRPPPATTTPDTPRLF